MSKIESAKKKSAEERSVRMEMKDDKEKSDMNKKVSLKESAKEKKRLMMKSDDYVNSNRVSTVIIYRNPYHEIQ